MSNLICPLCNGKNLEQIADRVRFDKSADVYCCKSCTLIFLDQNSFKYPDDFYQKEYHQTYLTHVEPDAFDPKAYQQKMLKATRIWAERFSRLLTGDEVILDVGCSTGHFLKLMEGKAAQIFGYELNRKEVAFCRDDCGLDVSDEPLAHRFDPETFDFITLIYVLEHIAEPVEFLNYLKRYLKPSGKMVILVPNAMDPLVNFYDIPKFRRFYYCIEHLFYYTPKTLDAVLEKADLSTITETLQEYPITNHLNWGYRKQPSDTIASRSGIPDIPLKKGTPEGSWKALWESMNSSYREFLTQNGYGDRIWAVAEKAS